MPYFACNLDLEAGAVVRPGNWGRIVRLFGPQHTEWQREVILERIRVAEFPALPSRFDVAFVIDDIAEARYYVSQKASVNILYEVELIDKDASTHVADWKGTGPYDSDEWARRYWRGDLMPHPETQLLLRERLTTSRIKIGCKI